MNAKRETVDLTEYEVDRDSVEFERENYRRGLVWVVVEGRTVCGLTRDGALALRDWLNGVIC